MSKGAGENDEYTEADVFDALLKVMGVENYDPTVLTALSEYARRFTSDILSDAKDYATHAGRSEIDISDLKLAITLFDSRTTGINVRTKCLHDAAEEINSRPLPPISVSTGSRLSLPSNDLLNRAYSLVPGSEAYPDLDTATRSSSAQGQGHNQPSSNAASHGVKRDYKIHISPSVRLTNISAEGDDQYSMV